MTMLKIFTSRKDKAANVRIVSFETPEEKQAINASNVTTQNIGSETSVKVWGDIAKFTEEMKKRFGAENVVVL